MKLSEALLCIDCDEIVSRTDVCPNCTSKQFFPIYRVVRPFHTIQTEKLPGFVVHIMRKGYPLCGFSQSLPKFWPTGHSWVGLENKQQATCENCLNSLESGQREINSATGLKPEDI